MRALRLALAALAALLAVAVLAAWLLPGFLQWDEYRQTIAAIASTGLGRPVRIDGPIRLSLLPQATLRARDVSIADTGDGVSATAAEMRLQVELAALLAGRVQPRDLALGDAHLHLPWPLSARFLREGRPAAGLHAQLENATLDVGQLSLSAINGSFAVDASTGTLSAHGTGSVLGRSWQLTGRLGQPGSDGSATLEVSLDGQGALVNTGALLSGVIAPDGGLSGRISGRGPDLSLLLPAPARPWRADGRVIAGSGLAVADDLEAEIGGSLARGAVALRFLPKPRLDAAMATSRLDLDAWLPSLLQGGRTALPTGIDLSADSATLAGGTLRGLRAGFDLQPGGATVRDASAVLPGDAELQLAGRLQDGRFIGTGRLSAPNLPQTLDWVRPHAPSILAALPPGTLQSLTLAATVSADAGTVALTNAGGSLDGVAITGNIALQGGDHPAVAANLKLAEPVLDRWLPALVPAAGAPTAGLAAWGNSVLQLGGLSATLSLEATAPTWLGTRFDRLSLSLRSSGGNVTVREAVLTSPALTLGLSGALSGPPGAAVLTDGQLDLRMARASLLGERLPPAWRSVEPLFRGPATLHVAASSQAGGLRFAADSAVSGAELQIDGTLDVPNRRWTGGFAFRHPGAPRLLEAVGLPGTVSWLGDGSLSVQADVVAVPDRISLANLDVAAGSLRATADLAVDDPFGRAHTLTGTIHADTLPLPLPYIHSTEPWLLAAAEGWAGQVNLQAGHVLFGLSPGLANAAATLVLAADGAWRVDGLSGTLGGGRLAGQLAFSSTRLGGPTPHLSAKAQLNGATITEPLLGGTLDISAGTLDLTGELAADGYSPAGLLATVGGTLSATVHNGTLDGLDAPAVSQTLAAPAGDTAVQDALAAALNAGSTPFSQLSLSATASDGSLTFGNLAVTLPAGQIQADGSLDLPTGTLLSRLTLQPGIVGAPPIALRLSGPVFAPHRTPDWGDLVQWLAAHRG